MYSQYLTTTLPRRLLMWALVAIFLSAGVPLVQSQSRNTNDVAPLILRGDDLDSVLSLLEKLTSRSIIRPNGLPSPKFTFTSQRPLTVDERIRAIESLLALNQITVVPVGDLFLKVVASGQAVGRGTEMIEGNLKLMPDTEATFSKMYRLNHLTTAEIQPLLQPFMSPTGVMTLFEKANAVLITDALVNLKRVESILQTVDQPSNPNVIVKFYDIQHAAASEVVTQVESIIESGYSKYLNANSTIKADDRTNQIIVVTHPSNLKIIEQFIREIDVDKGPRIFNEAVALRHADATELAGILNEIISGQSQDSSSKSRQTQGANNQAGNNQSGGNQPGPSVTVRGASAAGDDYGLQFSDHLTIVADERSNALIVTGTERDLEQAKQLIDKIDVALPQVRIDVVIAEVKLTDGTASGIQELLYDYAGNTDGSSIPKVVGNAFSLNPYGDNEGIFLSNLSMDIAVEAINTNSNARLINVPTIMTMHNQEAKVIVGESRPIITGTQTSGTTGATNSSVSYRDIGIELTVTPLIGSDGTIQLEIDQTVDDLGEDVTIDENQQPVIIRRQATSYVSVEDGKMIVLAGFQQANLRDTKNKFPILGDIPLLGSLINPRTRTDVHNELIFFIRPKVIHSGSEAHQDAIDAQENFANQDVIKQALSERASGMEKTEIEEPKEDEDSVKRGFGK